VRKFLLALVALAVVGAIAWPKLRPARAPSAPAKKGDAPRSDASAPLRVTAVTVAASPFAETVSATGTLRAEESVDLQPEINGKIVALDFEEGARVRKGDLLVKLNDADLRGTLQRAAWRRELAELRERRLAKLLESASVKQDDYDAALNDLNIQRAEVAITEAMIAKTEIRAPFDGVIGLRFVSEGAFVNATTRIATLQSVARVKLDFSVPEKYGGRIRLGSPLSFTVPGSERKFSGKIYALDPRIDAGTRTVLVRAMCDNTDGRLLAGGFANVEFTLAETPDAILVPAIAVIPGVSDKNVFVVIDGRAARRTVVTGMRNESFVQVLEGLKSGEIVITSGLQQMRSGLPVAVVEGGAPAQNSAPRAGPRAAGNSSKRGAGD